ncbi:MAG: hypothetical protein ACI825_001944, partial [Planctomycetota bacterium]
MKRTILLYAFSLFIVSCKIKTNSQVAQQKPNIIYIMADDLTIQAISAYGGIYKDIAP